MNMDGNGKRSHIQFSNNDGDRIDQEREETPLFQNLGKRRKTKQLPVSEQDKKTTTTITYPAITVSLLALVLSACVLVGFVFNIKGLRLWNHSDANNSATASGQSSKPTQLFDEFGRFVLENYDTAPPFSDFLPALAGYYGKPLYAFYVNRGQGIASFGIRSKDFPIMEFNTANKAYQNTPLLGFRTFLQGQRKGRDFLVEPFSPLTSRIEGEDSNKLPKRWMYIGSNEMQIQEIDHRLGIETNSSFFILPEEDFGSFVKRTTIRNMRRSEELNLSLLDGLAKIEPAGAELNIWLKNTGRTLEGLMGVYSPYNDTIQMPFYRLSSHPQDNANVQTQQAGHWCLSVVEQNDLPSKLLPIIFDQSKVFGQDTTFIRPAALLKHSIGDVIRNPQYGLAKTPSAFAALDSVVLQGGGEITISTYYGKADHVLDVPMIATRLLQLGFSQYKMSRAREIIEQITACVQTSTSNQLFDRHVQQMFLDNSLRGGIPNILGDLDDDARMRNANEDKRLKVLHLFSRIHGDLERDYNDFVIEPTFFSEVSATHWITVVVD